MKNLLKILIAVFILSIVIEINPAPFDTGMTELQQPDETTFIGRIWGDEFFWWAETQDGYRFVQSGDGWYYYAQLNQDGEFAPTSYKVGIDTPPASSYQLDRTQTRIDEINELIKEFNEQIELNRQWYAQKQSEAQGQPVTLKVGIILIEFQDVKHFDPDEFPRLGGYLTADFDSMMFSYNYWNAPLNNNIHPEGEEIFGSFRDYWDQMSKGKLRIEGRVVNPTDENGVPFWLTADYTRAYYSGLSDLRVLANEAIQKAIDYGYVGEELSDSNYYDKYAVVYAQEAIGSGSLYVHAQTIGGKYHFLAERSGPNLYGGLAINKSFTHIGIYAHEFGHTIGFYDEYTNGTGELGGTNLYNFCSMGYGIYNGPDRKGACPATVSPWYRIEYGWISSITLTADTSNLIVQYSNSNPILYRLNPLEGTEDEHFLIETKQREGFDQYIPSNPLDSVNQTGRLLIWQHNTHSHFPTQNYQDRIRIVPADNIRNSANQISDFFPADFTFNNYQSFNDLTIPASTINDSDPGDNQPGKPAHFALNGIQKLSDGNTLIETIRLNHPLWITNQNAGGWQLVSVPNILSDYSTSVVFPNCTTVYDVNNQIVTTLNNGPGYWGKFPSGSQSVHFKGTDVLEYLEIPVINGWLLTGSISYYVPRSSVYSIPGGILTSIYKYQSGSGYILLTSNDKIEPGIGYWTNTSGAGHLIIDRFSELYKINSSSDINLANMDKFIITDSDGYSQTLYVSNIDIDTAMADINLELPPFFSELNFDSRFEYNEFVKRVSADSGAVDLNILVHTNSFPVNVTWEINPANGIIYSFINDSTSGKISNISLIGVKSFSNLDNNKIRLLASVGKTNSSNHLPKEFSLEQNYPNPFNPNTVIGYQLPMTGYVTLKVYDVLGKEVATLVNDYHEAGRYEITFDASFASGGLASGVYIYTIKAGSFIQSKKMVIIR